MSIMRIYNYVKRGIRNLIYWFPIIWNDRNWDHYYLTAILRHKLNDMQKSFSGPNAWSVDAKKEAEKMKFCVEILDRIMEDDYNRESFDEHDKKWGELTFFREDDGSVLRRTKPIKKEDEEIEHEEFVKICEDEIKFRDTDIETLFTILKENLLRWWD